MALIDNCKLNRSTCRGCGTFKINIGGKPECLYKEGEQKREEPQLNIFDTSVGEFNETVEKIKKGSY